MHDKTNRKSAYAKRPLWQWLIIYLLVGVVVYGLIYIVVARRNSSLYQTIPSQSTNQPNQPLY